MTPKPFTGTAFNRDGRPVRCTVPDSPTTYFILRTPDGQYLQHQWGTASGSRYWLAAKPAWTPCCDTRAEAERFLADATDAGLAPLVIVEMTLAELR